MFEQKSMEDLLKEVEEASKLVDNWKAVKTMREWTFYQGSAGEWSLLVVRSGLTAHADGTASHRPTGTILHLTPELAAKVAELVTSWLGQNKGGTTHEQK